MQCIDIRVATKVLVTKSLRIKRNNRVVMGKNIR